MTCLFRRRALACGLSLCFSFLGSQADAAEDPLFASFPGRDPRLRWDRSGNLQVIYVEDRAAGAAVVYRRLGADPAGPFDVSPPGVATAARTESPPVLEVLPDGTLVAAYPVTLPGKWQSEIRVQRSTDRGKSWSEPRLLHAAGTGAHSFLSAATGSAGDAVFAWLDSRSGQMGLYAASTRDGLAFTPDQVLDPRTCQCCGTELLAGRSPDLWLVYRDLEAGDVRDFRVLRSRSSPPAFGPESKLSDDRWKVEGCPETGARLAEGPGGTLWAAWFTAGGQAGIYVASSTDGGASFSARTPLTYPEHPGRSPALGVLPDGRVAVLYQGVDEDGSTPILMRLRAVGGTWGPPRRLAPVGAYPRLAVEGERAAVSFSCRSGEKSFVVVADWSLAESGPQSWAPCGAGGLS